jgi:hypothetical protein
VHLEVELLRRLENEVVVVVVVVVVVERKRVGEGGIETE